RHHTFFEMLGNFSFGDYFKRDAICYAWEFLTSAQWLALPKEKLWVTVYASDDEAFDIWAKEIGVPEERIIRIGDNKGAPYASDNFWQMGDTGPCGPCTEIFYDHGDHIWGGPPGSPEEDGDRYIEIWNNVFMQFNRQADGTLLPLPKPSVDTGMGLERITAVMQHVNSNYEIDVFQTLIAKAAEIIGVTDLNSKSLRVIADHIRSCAFLVSDGVMPSNEGRGYVLRRIIRRAVRHGYILGAKETFFYKLVGTLIAVMGDAANELQQQQALVEKILRLEEEQFARTLERGLMLLDDALSNLTGDVLDGETAFKLYDTYGFPLDLTADVCRERNLTVDEAGFDVAMEAQRQRAQAASNFGADYNAMIRVDSQTQFHGYTATTHQGQVVALFREGQAVEQIVAGDDAIIVLDQTAFYAESGGQVGDSGQLQSANATFSVTDTQKYGNAFGHVGKLVSGSVNIGDTVDTLVNAERREQISLNHSATHLLHAALRQVLGEHVAQKGSLVTAESLRFDFSHFEAMKADELRAVERLVNAQIRQNHLINTEIVDLEEAKTKGAMALFGEKYEEKVRVLSMGDFSTELCGGVHATRTGDIGLFRITSESGIAAGVRRLEAVTGQGAIDFTERQQDQLDDAAQLVKSDAFSVADKLRALLDRSKQLEKELQQLKDKAAAQESANLVHNTVDVKGTKLLVSLLQGGDAKALRTMVDDLKNQLGSGIVVLGLVQDDKVSLIAGVTKDLVGSVKAGELV
ncbi:MAG: alanine--tRNA ligase, partial [Plesiomonas sp.]